MGKLVWAAIGFSAAALAAEYFLPVSGLPYIAAALAVLSVFGLLLKGGRRRIAMTLALSAALGMFLWWGRYMLLVSPCEALAGQDITVTAYVTDYPEPGEGYTGIPLRIIDGAPRVRGYIYCYDDDGEIPALEPGDEVTVTVRVLSAMETSSGERRHSQTALGRSFLCRALGVIEKTGRSDISWLYFPQRLAKAVKELCVRLFPEDAAPFIKALLTGDKADLYADVNLYGAMRASGVLHIVAVSGMHLVILVSFLQMLLGRGRRTSLICIPVMLVFVLMAGGGASVVRAAVMQSVLLLAPVFEREYDGPSGLAAALLAILIVNPMAIGGTAFQLSFSCVLGFVVFFQPLKAWCVEHLAMDSGLVRTAAGSIISTFCATVFSMPLSAYYFGVIPLFSWLANLLTLYIVTLCFAGGYIVCAAGAVWLPLGTVLARLVSWPIRLCMLVYRLIAKIPFGCFYTLNPAAVICLVCIYALFFAWWLLRRHGKRVYFILPAELCVIGICVVFLTGGLSFAGGDEVAVLDVGQGECVVLLDDTAAVMVDCGGSSWTNPGDIAADFLLSNGRTRVDMLILTHLHEDHTNGVASLLARLPVTYLILPADHDDDDRMLEGILAAAAGRDTTVLFLEEETAAQVGGMTLTMLLPEAGSDENERGIVVLAELSQMNALIMGDAGQSAELKLLSRGVVPDVDILVVGHHGSGSASGLLFLRAASPETAAISAGANNPYGHPADAVIGRLSDIGADILRTDEDGTVMIRQKAGEELYG